MVIVGIDPGVISTGYGVIEVLGREARSLEYGMIAIDRRRQLNERLAEIYDRVADVCRRFRPQALSVEDIFFNKNARTALTVGHVRGAVILAALHQGAEVFTYTPLQIKETVSGYGRADKEQVQRMVQLLLKLPQIPEPDHCADALAAALCHYYCGRGAERFRSLLKGEDQ